MPGGRPTTKPENISELVGNYLKEAKQLIELPSVAGLASFIGCSKASLYGWAKDDPQFLDSLDKLNLEQEKVVLNKSLNNEWNSAISKLILHNHGYTDKQQMEMSGALKVLKLDSDEQRL